MTWTNESVLSATKDIDPIKFVEGKARDLVLRAIDEGWEGPPYDPLILAGKLGIQTIANASINDAKLYYVNNKKIVEYNPQKSRSRVRFSIAHEIAHTFFPDWFEEVRHRHVRSEISSDDWQLEMLCNIAAAEILMPVGSYKGFPEQNFNLAELVEVRKKYQVSMEAVLIRYAKKCSENIAVFCASRIEVGRNRGRYKIDYLIPSGCCSARLKSGALLPKGSPIYNCTAIGFQSQGVMIWPGRSEEVAVEAIGLPSYPGAKYPRVAGLIHINGGASEGGAPSINYHTGDARNPGGLGSKVIVHIVNDATPNWGGGGFAVALKRRYPEVQTVFRDLVLQDRSRLKLGSAIYTPIDHEENIGVMSLVAQRGYRYTGSPLVRYAALEEGLKRLAELAIEQDASVHMPRIGTGNAGGDWALIEELIKAVLVNKGIEVNVYDIDA